ncbi:MAG: tryptophan--tRNA ligase [Christensenellales bacterium]|jgi:tryptophanyl-tRNA synthetase|nr:tryptophan--tRNA ligase [Clostridiales bacterium]
MEKKKTVYSGIQPTGCLTLGNYIGAIRNWLKLQEELEEYFCIYSIVDLHALTTRQNPALFRKTALSFFAQLLAVGLDPEKSILYFQSHVPQHAELTWVLNCFTYVGEAGRMTQFKEKSRKHKDNINMGLMSYPVLMAADILLYQTDLVPVGIDQKQHLELTRDIAMRFNAAYSPTFTIPQPYIPKTGAKICSLSDPTAKMSKSDPDENATISIIDPPQAIMNKIKRAVTDCESVVEYREGKHGINNLLTIFSAVSGRSIEDIADEYRNKGYAAFKNAVGEAVVEELRPIRERYEKLMADKEYLMQVIRSGDEKADRIARRTLSKVYRKIGLVER